MSTVLEQIKTLLDTNNINYSLIKHKPVYTSTDAAKIRDTDISMGAKALVCYADRNPILIVIPGDKKVDFKKFKKIFGVKDLRMATPQEVLEVTTLKVGSIPPLGTILKLSSFYDKEITQKDKVAFNAGSLTNSVIMKSQDLLNLEKPQVGEFCQTPN